MAVDDCPAPASVESGSAGRSTPPPALQTVVADDRTARSAPASTLLAEAADDRAEQSGSPPASPMATDDCSVPAAGTSSTTEGGEGTAALTATSSCPRVVRRQHQPKRDFTPRACVECNWAVVYDCRSALNRHMRSKHGVFYSAKHDCYVALRGGEPRVQQQSGSSALRHSPRTTSTGSNAERRKLPKLASEEEEPSQPVRRNRRRRKPAPPNPGARGARGARSVTVGIGQLPQEGVRSSTPG